MSLKGLFYSSDSIQYKAWNLRLSPLNELCQNFLKPFVIEFPRTSRLHLVKNIFSYTSGHIWKYALLIQVTEFPIVLRMPGRGLGFRNKPGGKDERTQWIYSSSNTCQGQLGGTNTFMPSICEHCCNIPFSTNIWFDFN